MKKTQTFYKHCVLERKVDSGHLQQQVWIPEKYAVVGLGLKLKEGDKWQDGWKVLQVGGRADEQWISGVRRLWRKHRTVTDVPKGTFKGQ